MQYSTRLPATPLITHDPYFSIWAPGDTPTAEDTVHWSGIRKILRGSILVDGVERGFLSRGLRQAMRCVDTRVTPLSTEYILEDLGVRLSVKFTSPLLLDDLDVLSTPISYIDVDVSFIDGRSHEVEVALTADAGLCHSGEEQPEMRQDFFSADGLNYAYMGQVRQAPLAGSGDRLTCNWGYLFLASEETLENRPVMAAVSLVCVKRADSPFRFTLLIGYDDIASINYFGRMLPAYYARNGKTITQVLAEFYRRHDELLDRCAAFDRQLLDEARAKGGEDYALLVTASYRQTIAGHKLVADTNGELLFISKENDSNGCAATTDISYPSVPLFLLYAPELVCAMLRPIFKVARLPIWTYDFAPHDAGRYPILNGQIYAARHRSQHEGYGITHPPYYLYPATVDAYRAERQMPVEESANAILMAAAAGYADGDWRIAKDNLDLLQLWCSYLLTHGEDPGNQMCTDDFAGHLARNVNLSAKAVMGIAAFGMILDALGRGAEAKIYRDEAKRRANSWLERAAVGDHTALTFDGQGWSLKYNLVWDKLFGLDLLPDSFYSQETKSYLARSNTYGIPLDSRSVLTKSDWLLWCAAMADADDFAAFLHPVARYVRETPSRVPFSDFYHSEDGVSARFIARTVQGGLYMPLLMDRWKKRRESAQK